MNETRKPLWRRILVPTLTALTAGGVAIGALLMVQGTGQPTATLTPSATSDALTFGDPCASSDGLTDAALALCDYALDADSQVLAFADASGAQVANPAYGGSVFLAGSVDGGSIPWADGVLTLAVTSRDTSDAQAYTRLAISTDAAPTPSATARVYPPLLDAARAAWPGVEVQFLDASEAPTTDAASADLILTPLDTSVVRGDRQDFEAAEGFFSYTALPMPDRGVIVWTRDLYNPLG